MLDGISNEAVDLPLLLGTQDVWQISNRDNVLVIEIGRVEVPFHRLFVITIGIQMKFVLEAYVEGCIARLPLAAIQRPVTEIQGAWETPVLRDLVVLKVNGQRVQPVERLDAERL
ncbi:Translation elongation factor EF-Tu [Pseudomonas syringae pv. actinidiae]|uniref:Translation elongation factor EF-Tu n=1 Tax=Pseudomonas syringae pv. actinidiae TaxID=103796 RepID=A0A2V0QJY9_PSESF|nr:Translation elongation factor EF-Tu [Pseudomonas syringae pv. actinidiae]